MAARPPPEDEEVHPEPELGDPAEAVPGPGLQVLDFVVPEAGAGRRADVWLAHRFPHYSRTRVARLFAEGRIQGLDRQLKPSSLLQEGERLRLFRPHLRPRTPPPPLPAVIFEDDRIVAFDKPAGMLVHPSGSRFVWALISLARPARPGVHLHLLHRLDRDTSGVVVMAKDAEANRFLKAAFHDQHVEKCYWAVCRGVPPWTTLLVDEPLGPHPASAVRLRMGIREDGQPARTRFHLLAAWRDMSLVAAWPRTGRTHQIRVHLEHAGFPLVGDPLYGQPDEVFLRLIEPGGEAEVRRQVGFARQALHARLLRLPHPDGGFVEIRAPLPQDLRALVAGRRCPEVG